MHTRKLASGAWRVIVQVDGVKRSATAPTKREAEREGARLLLELGGKAAATDMTVGELLDDHLANHPLAAGTKQNYETARRLHLPASFEARQVATITPPAIDALYRGLEPTVTAHALDRLNALLSGAFRRAVRAGRIELNPCRDALLPAPDEPDTRTPETDEARTLLDACDTISVSFGLYARVVAQTGARPGEVVALQRGDVVDDSVTIERAASRVKGAVITGPTKTGKRGIRRLAIGPVLAKRIQMHIDEQDAELARLGAAASSELWLFTDDYRRPWYPSTPSRWWREARDAAGITDIRLYDLRHYVATELFAGGFDDQTTMRRLGHTNPSMGSKRYATNRPARDRLAAEHLEAQLEGE